MVYIYIVVLHSYSVTYNNPQRRYIYFILLKNEKQSVGKQERNGLLNWFRLYIRSFNMQHEISYALEYMFHIFNTLINWVLNHKFRILP